MGSAVPLQQPAAVPGEQLTTRAVERRCQLVIAALDALRDATRKLAAPYASFQTATLIEAQARSAIEGIVTTVGEMIEHMDRPRLTNGADPDTHDALRHLRQHH